MHNCSPVVEVHGVRLADDTPNEGGEGKESGGKSELHYAIEGSVFAEELREEEERSSWLDVVPSREVRTI